MRPLLAVTVSLALTVVACTDGREPSRPAQAGTAVPATEATEASSEPAAEPAAWNATRQGTPGFLAVDYAPREGWDPGRPGASRGALLPRDLRTGEELPGYRPVNVGQASHRFAWTPDRRYLAFVSTPGGPPANTGPRAESVRVVEGESWAEVTPPDLASLDGVVSFAWVPDGRSLLVFRNPGETPPGASQSVEAWTVDVQAGSRTLVTSGDFQTAGPPLVAPDGDMAYALGFRANQCCGIEVQGPPFVVAIDLSAGDMREVALEDVAYGQSQGRSQMPGLALSPDGSRIFVAHPNDDLLTEVNLDRLEVARTFQPRESRSALSRLGAWLAGQFVSRAEAKGALYFRKDVAFSPDGRLLYVTGSHDEACPEAIGGACRSGVPFGLQVVDVESGALLAWFEDISQFTQTPDGRYALGTGWTYEYTPGAERAEEIGHGLRVIDTHTLEVAYHVLPEGLLDGVVASPDGAYAYVTARAPGYEASMTSAGLCTEACIHLHVVDLADGEVVATRGILSPFVALASLYP
ncbi:MAG: hypothetical protein M0R73_08820 [Dehalococcoidia bacterium]|nr:hypothetical protein [Dehalococcoidia bacterium]